MFNEFSVKVKGKGVSGAHFAFICSYLHYFLVVFLSSDMCLLLLNYYYYL